MLKCKVIESFSSLEYTGVAGMIQEFPDDEARKFASVGFLEILPEDQQEPEPMAFETAREARNFETATAKRGRPKK